MEDVMKLLIYGVLTLGLFGLLAYGLWPEPKKRGEVFTLDCHPLEDSTIDIDCNWLKK